MARRLFNGRRFSENGWPYVDEGSCTWVTVPGTSVTLQIQNGPPLALLRAWAADWNAYIEPLRDADSACWTPGNSVATSNHPGGTAVDLNWESHQFRQRGTLNPAQMATLSEMETFYEGMVFWAGRWDDPVDEMHSQVGYGTYDQAADAPLPKVLDFIARKIRADGYSTFRRGNSVVLSTKDRYALAVITEGQRLGISPKGIQIALATTLVETNLTMYANSNVPESLGYPHDAMGSDHDSTGLFQQRQAWGPLSETMDPTLSARLFFNGGHAGQRGLTDFDYNSDSRTPGGWAQAVQVSAFPDRYDGRYPEAVDLYNRLANLGDDDFMPALSDDEQREVLSLLRVLAKNQYPSRSPLRHLGEGNIDTIAGIGLNEDGNVHVVSVIECARVGDYRSLALLAEVAGADPVKYPDRQADALLARRILADLEANYPAVLQAFLNSNGAQK